MRLLGRQLVLDTNVLVHLTRLDPKQLEAELGTISIPVGPLDTSAPAKQQAAG